MLWSPVRCVLRLWMWIFKYDNVIFTPHAAFYSETALEEVRRRSAENVTHFLAGEGDINYVVKPQ